MHFPAIDTALGSTITGMPEWILAIEIDGEWEQCTFSNRDQALHAFAAITADYKTKVRRAALVASLRPYPVQLGASSLIQ